MTDFTITVSVPDDKAQEVLETITNHIGYGKLSKDDPRTRTEFLQQHVRSYLSVLWNRAKRQAVHDAAEEDAVRVEFQ